MELKFEPIHFFDVGDFLKTNSIPDKKESCLRTAIGRFFYCALLNLDCALFLQGDFSSFKRKYGEENTHIAVIEYCKSKREYFAIGTALGKLKELRKTSDYHPKEHVDEEDFEAARALFLQIKTAASSQNIWYNLEEK